MYSPVVHIFILPFGLCISMQIRRLPPTRTSILATGTVAPFGPYQFLKCSGWVHICQMKPTAASKVRSITTSSLEIVLSLIIILLVIKLVNIVIHAVEACLPNMTVLLCPLGYFFQRLYSDGAGAILRFLSLCD